MTSTSATADNITAVLDKIVSDAAGVDAQAAFPSDNVKMLGREQLLGLLVPTKFGGKDATSFEFANTTLALGGACASTGMIFVMHCCAVETLAKHMPESSVAALLKDVAAGKHLSTLACSETGTGANFYASTSTSAEGNGGYVLDASKCFVTSGGHADSYVVATRAVGSDDSINTALYLVMKDNGGVSFEGNWNGLGLRGNSSVAMRLKKCQVEKNALLGKQGQGLEIELGTILPRFLLGSAAVYNGIAISALQCASDHLKERSFAHTGEALSALPVLRNRIAQMKVAVSSSVALMNEVASAWDMGADANEVLVRLFEVKQLACKTSIDVTAAGMDVCGGIAFAGKLPLERHFRDARAGTVMAPTNDMLLDLIGRAQLGMPLM